MRALCILLLLTLPLGAIGAQQQIQTFLVRSQPAAALVDTVQPLLTDGGSVSAYHDKLIVSGSARELRAVQTLLAQIDRPPRRLIIEVRRAGSTSTSASGVGYGVRTDQVQLGRVPPGRDAQVRIQQAETQFNVNNLQRVRALDGRPALIRAGQRVPMYQAYQDVYGNRVVQGFRMQYRDVDAGFVAVPRVHGDQVTVEIHQRHRGTAAGGGLEHQGASTVLNGGLGEWMVLTMTGGSDSDERNELGLNYQAQRTREDTVELRVLALD